MILYDIHPRRIYMLLFSCSWMLEQVKKTIKVVIFSKETYNTEGYMVGGFSFQKTCKNNIDLKFYPDK